MRQAELKEGDVILYSDGSTHLVLERDRDAGGVQGRVYIRYLNLRTGVSSSRLGVGLANRVRGEVIRGRETVWTPEPQMANGLSPDWLAACDGGK